MTVSLLVVDDEPDVHDVFKRPFRRELKSGDYAMRFALSGEEALELLKQQGIEQEVMVILSDINMPGISGLELLQEAQRQWPELPVIMITAYGDSENRQKAQEAGASDFVTKPVDFDALKARITDILASSMSQP